MTVFLTLFSLGIPVKWSSFTHYLLPPPLGNMCDTTQPTLPWSSAKFNSWRFSAENGAISSKLWETSLVNQSAVIHLNNSLHTYCILKWKVQQVHMQQMQNYCLFILSFNFQFHLSAKYFFLYLVFNPYIYSQWVFIGNSCQFIYCLRNKYFC